jgi:hypothetical protein
MTRLALLLCLFLIQPALANPSTPPKPTVPPAKPTPATPAQARSAAEAKSIAAGIGIGMGGNATATGGNASAAGGAGGQGGQGGQGGSSQAIAGATTGPVSISIEGAAAAPDSVTIKNVPDVTVMIASPTAPCRNTVGVGLAVAGFGGSLGSSELDTGCDTREDARLLYNMGLQAESVARLCAKPEMAAALGPKCPKKD